MILITGGIGSGKSVVSTILRTIGYEVYDCDSRARALMEADLTIKDKLTRHIHPGAVDESGHLDRRLISSVVFSDRSKLQSLNAIVHEAVRRDIRREMEVNPMLFVETAIPVSSLLDSMANEVWEVVAPAELRLERVVSRSHLTPDEIRRRMAVQCAEQPTGAKTIVNDGLTALLPQLHTLLYRL